MSEAALANLAALKTVLEEERSRHGGRCDYFDIFVPFVAERLQASAEELVSVPELQRDLQYRFGIELPQHVLGLVLKRTRRRGYITLSHKVYHKALDKLKRFEFPASRESAYQQQQRLVATLREYCSTVHGVSWSDSQVLAALESFVWQRHIAIVRALSRRVDLDVDEGQRDEALYLVGKFVRHLMDEGGPEVEFLETVVQGIVLASAVYYHEAPNADRNFKDTTVFCDTEFLLFALQHGGEAVQAPCVELLNLLKETGAGLACFEHTLQEMQGVLDMCADRLERGEHTDTREVSFLLHSIRAGKTALDLRLASTHLPERLASLGIEVTPAPAFDTYRYTIDEKGLSETIQANMGYSLASTRAIGRDVDSISSVMRLRSGKNSRSVETCGAVLLTSNTRLAGVAATFFRDELGPASIPPCLTDQALTSLVWLKQPSRMPSLARKWLIADCHAAMSPGHGIWQRYVEELDKCMVRGEVSNEEYYLMRYSSSAPAVLMEVTRGNEDVLTHESVAVLRERIEQRIRQKAVREKDVTIAQLGASLEVAERDVAQSAERESRRRGVVEDRARRRATLYIHVAKWVTICVLLAASLLPLLGVPPNDAPPFLKWGVVAVAVLYAVAGAANMYCGFAILPWLTELENRITCRLVSHDLRQAGFEQ